MLEKTPPKMINNLDEKEKKSIKSPEALKVYEKAMLEIE